MKIFPKTASGNFIAAWSAFLCAGFLRNGISDTGAMVVAVYGFINLVMSVVRFVRWVFAPSEKGKPLVVNVDVRIVEIKREANSSADGGISEPIPKCHSAASPLAPRG